MKPNIKAKLTQGIFNLGFQTQVGTGFRARETNLKMKN